jgi:hypothetical protein
MSNNRSLATPEEVAQKIEQIIDYHARGKESLQHSLRPDDQAIELGWNVTKLRKARQFARQQSGYNQQQLEALCELLIEHRPVFGISHIGLLVTVPRPERDKFQHRCIVNNWSVQKLETEIKSRFGIRSPGGRKRRFESDEVFVLIEDMTTAWYRFFFAAKTSQQDQPPGIKKLSKPIFVKLRAVLQPMLRLRAAVQTMLAPTRKGDEL